MQENESLFDRVLLIKETARLGGRLFKDAIEGDAASALEFEIHLASLEPDFRNAISDYFQIITEVLLPIVSKIEQNIKLTPGEKQTYAQLLKDLGFINEDS